jgi:hypothetical protein
VTITTIFALENRYFSLRVFVGYKEDQGKKINTDMPIINSIFYIGIKKRVKQ